MKSWEIKNRAKLIDKLEEKIQDLEPFLGRKYNCFNIQAIAIHRIWLGSVEFDMKRISEENRSKINNAIAEILRQEIQDCRNKIQELENN